ncbi:MAG: Benzoyl-CoA reductase/2-hydroxyglutaryl-CoA dehydratase subunit [Candidatus Alkanophagales archaeon MCA70_species_1]|nr:Benzoyl-CoA reductase/2-hydroxyglutaryl-CoA dehydratase subunit [Candidatus Alkanophaga volatiphilum]
MMLERVREVLDGREAVARSWKEQGKKVVGWICPYVPEELIHAAGMLPFRVMGAPVTIVKGDAYLYPNICTFNRVVLELALGGRYDFLDGIVTANVCDHIRRLYDAWHFFVETPFKLILSLPHKVSENAVAFFRDELSRLKSDLEKLAGVEISDAALKNSIRTYNRARELLRRIYGLRREEEAPISGAEALEVVKAGMFLPKEEYVALLEEIFESLKRRDERYEGSARVMIAGSDLDDPGFVKLIEDSGGLVVADDLCTGSRYFWEDVDVSGDPLEALARRYLSPVLCARMHPYEAHIEHLIKMAEDFNVDGIIFEALKFCDIYGGEYPLLREWLKEKGLDIPVLMLDREYVLSGVEQLKTRIQAFIESLS